MADALQMEDKPYLSETIRFIRNFDKFFDIMNVRSLEEYITKRKPDLKPFRSASDDRLKVCTARYKHHAIIKYPAVYSLSTLTVAEGRLLTLLR